MRRCQQSLCCQAAAIKWLQASPDRHLSSRQQAQPARAVKTLTLLGLAECQKGCFLYGLEKGADHQATEIGDKSIHALPSIALEGCHHQLAALSQGQLFTCLHAGAVDELCWLPAVCCVPAALMPGGRTQAAVMHEAHGSKHWAHAALACCKSADISTAWQLHLSAERLLCLGILAGAHEAACCGW